MYPPSGKYRLFCAVVLLGAVNLVLMAYLKLVCSTPTLSKLSRTPFAVTRGVSSALGLNSSSSTVVLHVTRRPSGYQGRVVLKVRDQEVRRRANVKAPWKPPQRNDSGSAPLCPLVPPSLVGPLQTYTQAPNWTEIVGLNPGLEVGGHYQPAQCRARHRVAVVVPYRDREKHLQVLLHNLHPMLIRQQLDYFVLVVELAQPTKFNRGLLLNIGAVEALGLRDVHCFVFHDVDLVPENDRNLYTCPHNPRHMSAAVDKFKYKLPYSFILGGVLAITHQNFSAVNGFSNLYFGWGGEDDDLRTRVSLAKLNVSRYPMNIARYHMINHRRDKKNENNPTRYAIMRRTKHLMRTDGLNSMQYRVQQVEFRPAYTWMLVGVNQTAYSNFTAEALKDLEIANQKAEQKKHKAEQHASRAALTHKTEASDKSDRVSPSHLSGKQIRWGGGNASRN